MFVGGALAVHVGDELGMAVGVPVDRCGDKVGCGDGSGEG